jgi:hypothetical protein
VYLSHIFTFDHKIFDLTLFKNIALPLLLFMLLNITTNNHQIKYLPYCMLDVFPIYILLCLLLGEIAHAHELDKRTHAYLCINYGLI